MAFRPNLSNNSRLAAESTPVSKLAAARAPSSAASAPPMPDNVDDDIDEVNSVLAGTVAPTVALPEVPVVRPIEPTKHVVDGESQAKLHGAVAVRQDAKTGSEILIPIESITVNTQNDPSPTSMHAAARISAAATTAAIMESEGMMSVIDSVASIAHSLQKLTQLLESGGLRRLDGDRKRSTAAATSAEEDVAMADVQAAPSGSRSKSLVPDGLISDSIPPAFGFPVLRRDALFPQNIDSEPMSTYYRASERVTEYAVLAGDRRVHSGCALLAKSPVVYQISDAAISTAKKAFLGIQETKEPSREQRPGLSGCSAWLLEPTEALTHEQWEVRDKAGTFTSENTKPGIFHPGIGLMACFSKGSSAATVQAVAVHKKPDGTFEVSCLSNKIENFLFSESNWFCMNNMRLMGVKEALARGDDTPSLMGESLLGLITVIAPDGEPVTVPVVTQMVASNEIKMRSNKDALVRRATSGAAHASMSPSVPKKKPAAKPAASPASSKKRSVSEDAAASSAKKSAADVKGKPKKRVTEEDLEDDDDDDSSSSSSDDDFAARAAAGDDSDSSDDDSDDDDDKMDDGSESSAVSTSDDEDMGVDDEEEDALPSKKKSKDSKKRSASSSKSSAPKRSSVSLVATPAVPSSVISMTLTDDSTVLTWLDAKNPWVKVLKDMAADNFKAFIPVLTAIQRKHCAAKKLTKSEDEISKWVSKNLEKLKSDALAYWKEIKEKNMSAIVSYASDKDNLSWMMHYCLWTILSTARAWNPELAKTASPTLISDAAYFKKTGALFTNHLTDKFGLVDGTLVIRKLPLVSNWSKVSAEASKTSSIMTDEAERKFFESVTKSPEDFANFLKSNWQRATLAMKLCVFVANSC